MKQEVNKKRERCEVLRTTPPFSRIRLHEEARACCPAAGPEACTHAPTGTRATARPRLREPSARPPPHSHGRARIEAQHSRQAAPNPRTLAFPAPFPRQTELHSSGPLLVSGTRRLEGAWLSDTLSPTPRRQEEP